MNWVNAEAAGICDWAIRHKAANGGCRLTRLSTEWLGRLPGEMARTALYPTGLEIRFRTDADALRFGYSFRPAPGPGGQTLAVWTRHDSSEYELCEGEYAELILKPAGEGQRSVRVHLPWKGEMTIFGIGMGSQFQFEPEAGIANRRICFYGDSITQGAFVSSPQKTFPHLVGMKLGVQSVNHGYGGAGYPDPAMAIHLGRDVAWDALCLFIGTNSYGRGLESGSEYGELYRAFIRTVRRYKPHSPLLCVTPIWRGSADGRGERNRRGDTLTDYRRAIENAVAELQPNDRNLAIVSGLSIIDGADGLSGDLLHPNDTGMERIANAVAGCLKRRLFPRDRLDAAEPEVGVDEGR